MIYTIEGASSWGWCICYLDSRIAQSNF